MSAPDLLRVRPGPLGGTLDVPGDKSVSHRALILGALADGPTPVGGLLASEDVERTAAALRRFGARVTLARAGPGLEGEVEGPLREPDDVIDCGNSGTTMRLLAGVAAGTGGLAVLTGDASLRRRPMDRVAEPLAAMGVEVLARDSGRLPPVVVASRGVTPVEYRSRVASAQVKSCVLLAGVAGGVPVAVSSPARSRDHTERLLRFLGAEVTTAHDAHGEHVRLGAARLRAAALAVPGDHSSAAFWMVAAACGAGTVTIRRVGTNPGRTGALRALRELGADVRLEHETLVGPEPVADLTVTPGLPGGAELSGSDVVDAIDELPVLALAGACSDGGLAVRDAAELRVKESDRIDALAGLFRALGMTLRPAPDGFVVPGGQRPAGGRVDAHGDHRIAMTAVVAGVVGDGPVEVAGAGAVATSYPGFVADLRRLGGTVEEVAA